MEIGGAWSSIWSNYISNACCLLIQYRREDRPWIETSCEGRLLIVGDYVRVVPFGLQLVYGWCVSQCKAHPLLG
jgi:hypothetical protein